MSKFELRVKVQSIGDTVEVGDKGFKKREVIGMVEGEYPEFFKFEFIQDNVILPDDLIEGTYATITFNLKGRKVASKKSDQPDNFFTTLQAWKVEI